MRQLERQLNNMKVKKYCDGCRAYEGGTSGCSLSYDTGWERKDSKLFKGHTVLLQYPVNKCPKPKTYKEFSRLVFKK